MAADTRDIEGDPELTVRLQALLQPRRLEALVQTGLLDSEPEAVFDRFTDFAARTLRAPIALVSLVDDERQFFKSCFGLAEPLNTTRQTPLTHSFCRLVTSGEPLVVDDARRHPLVHDNPAIDQMDVQAYLGYPLVMQTGEVLGSFCVIDTTPRTWTEDEKRLVSDLAAFTSTEIQLRLTLATSQRATDRLRQVERTLLDTLRRREEILDIVAHDLRDPLNTIKLCASLIREGEDSLDFSERIDRAADTMALLLRDLSGLARRRTDDDLIHDPEPQDAASLLSEAVDAFKPQADKRGLGLSRTAPEEPLNVYADRFRIQQALANLISNALRHTSSPGEVRLGAEPSGEGHVRFWVRDTGSGIEPDVLPHVFEPFRQGSQEAGGQSGLGLAIVRKIVEAHGGEVGIESEVDVGTTCWFTLPRA